jgi:hypothetical protein
VSGRSYPTVCERPAPRNQPARDSECREIDPCGLDPIWSLMDPVSYVSYVSWMDWVDAAETHETFHRFSGMRYQVSSSGPI